MTKKCELRISYPDKWAFKYSDNIKTVVNMQKFRKFCTYEPFLNNLVKIQSKDNLEKLSKEINLIYLMVGQILNMMEG